MKKIIATFIATILGIGVFFQLTPVSAAALPQAPAGSVYRFWNGDLQKHVMTTNYEEANGIHTSNPAWQYDGIVFRAYRMYETNDPSCGTTNSLADIHCRIECEANADLVFRFVGQNNSFFYAYAQESQYLMDTNPFWTFEGPTFCAKGKEATDSDTVKAYRYFYPAQTTHVFTASVQEKAAIDANPSWVSEGAVFTVFPAEEQNNGGSASEFADKLLNKILNANDDLQDTPTGNLQDFSIHYSIQLISLEDLYDEVTAMQAPQEVESLKMSAFQVLNLSLLYVEEAVEVLEDDSLTDDQKYNAILDLIDEYLPLLDEEVELFAEEATEYL